MSRHMSVLLTIGIAAAGIVLLVWMFQERLIYFPLGDVPPPSQVGLTHVEEVRFPTADGLTLNGWFIRSAFLSARVDRGGVQWKRGPSGLPCPVCEGTPEARRAGAPI